jgi:hypothetical protein
LIWKTWRRWEDNIKTDVEETEWESLDSMDLAQDMDK